MQKICFRLVRWWEQRKKLCRLLELRPLPSQSRAWTRPFTQVVYFGKWSQDAEVEHLEKRRWKRVITAYPSAFLSGLLLWAVVTQSQWAKFVKWYPIHLRIVHLRHKGMVMYASAPMWSRLYWLLIPTYCRFVHVMEWLSRSAVSLVAGGSSGWKPGWGAVRWHLYAARCWSTSWSKTGGGGGEMGHSDLYCFSLNLLSLG